MAFSVQMQQYWKLMTVVKRSVLGPWEIKVVADSRSEADTILGPSVFNVAYVYGESGQSRIWIITYSFVYG